MEISGVREAWPVSAMGRWSKRYPSARSDATSRPPIQYQARRQGTPPTPPAELLYLSLANSLTASLVKMNMSPNIWRLIAA
jgi:hypothetical protein